MWGTLSQPAAAREKPGAAVLGAQTERAGEAREAAVDPAVLAAAAAAQETLLQHGRRSKSPKKATLRCTSSHSACTYTACGWLGKCMLAATAPGQNLMAGLHRAPIAAWECAL